jgi:hypothetical protein
MVTNDVTVMVTMEGLNIFVPITEYTVCVIQYIFHSNGYIGAQLIHLISELLIPAVTLYPCNNLISLIYCKCEPHFRDHHGLS